LFDITRTPAVANGSRDGDTFDFEGKLLLEEFQMPTSHAAAKMS